MKCFFHFFFCVAYQKTNTISEQTVRYRTVCGDMFGLLYCCFSVACLFWHSFRISICSKRTTMDREIPKKEIKRTERKKWLKISGGFLALLVLFNLSYSYLSPSVSRQDLQIAKSERASIQETIPASGLVVPESEHLLTSLVNARIKEVNIKTGEKVSVGDAIVMLDKEEVESQLKALQDKSELKENEIRRQELLFNEQLSQRETALSVKELKIKRLETDLQNKQRLEAIGGSTREASERAALALEIAQLESNQEQYELDNFKKTIANDLEKLRIESNMLHRELEELHQKIERSDAVASMDGVVSWVKDEIGSDVKAGDELARIVNLSSYKVEGSIAASYAHELKTGRQVWLRFKDELLEGQITSVKPAVSAGIVNFDVSLKLASHPQLRANRKLDLYVLTRSEENVIRVKNGPVFTGSRYQKVYVLKDDKAYLKEVETGLSNFDYVEIVSGLEEGEELIVSSIKKFNEAEEIRIEP